VAVLAVDVGGTKLAAALVGPDGRVTREARVPTDRADPWPGLARLVDDVRAGVDVEAVGVGCGGPMTWPAGEISPLNLPAWRGFPLRATLAEHLGAPVRLHNDAVCMALGEHWLGAGRGVDDLLGMVVSTGVGGGLVLGGRLVDGASGNAGHVGHLVVEPDGPTCGCGGRGCLEAVARGPAVVARARARGSAARDGRELVGAAAGGDAVAREELGRAGRALGIGIAGAAALLDVRVVAVGGGLAAAGDALWSPLREELARRARIGFLAPLRVLPAELGQRAGIVGAAALWLRGDRCWSGD